MTNHAARSGPPVGRESGALRVRPTRVAIALPVVVTHRGARFAGTTVDFGLGGAFIETLLEPDFAERVEITLRLPAIVGDVRLPAVVRWRNAGGMGVQFLELGALETYALASLIEAVMKAPSRSLPESDEVEASSTTG